VFNERKILDASHVVVFCAKTAMDDAWLERVVDQEEADGRFANADAKAANHKGRTFFADMHRKELHDDDQWMAKQVYLNVGNFLLGVAAMGLDAVPIEGVDFAILDAEFDLKARATPAWWWCRSAIIASKTSTRRCRNHACRRRRPLPRFNSLLFFYVRMIPGLRLSPYPGYKITHCEPVARVRRVKRRPGDSPQYFAARIPPRARCAPHSGQ
jgi:hypothetical protein